MVDADVKHGVTIAITRYAEPDSIIAQSLHCALAQQGVRGEVLFIEQDPQSSLEAAAFPAGALALRIIRQRLRGLSEARNLALEQAANRLVMYLDADALAEPDWARQLALELVNPRCAVAGGKVVPGWPGRAPFFTRSGVLRDQYSLLDLGDEVRPYHRVVGAGFGIDRMKLPSDFRFDVSLGRRRGLLFGGEESDFCRRVLALGLDVTYAGGARVTHLIASQRCRWRWILKRMIYAGHGRARLGGAPSASGKAGFYDWLLLPVYLPFYSVGWLWGKLGTSVPSV